MMTEDLSPDNLSINFPQAGRWTVLLSMVISGFSATFICYTAVLCVRVTSTTTYSMVGALNKLPIIMTGFAFQDAQISVSVVVAIIVGILGGVLYAIAKRNKPTEENLKETEEV